MGSLTSLNLSGNALCGVNKYGMGTYDATGIKEIADALRISGSLTVLDARDNRLGREGKAALQDAVRSKEGFRLHV